MQTVRISLIAAIFGVAVIGGVSLSGTTAYSQQLPSPAEPTKPVEQVIPGLPPSLPPEIEISPAPGGVAPPEADLIQFVLKGLAVEGATIYTAPELESLYVDLIGTEVALRAVFDVAKKIEAKYRADGYILTRAIVPHQTVTDGVFRVQVVEGFVSGVTIEGEVGDVRALIERYLEKITLVRPINNRDLERYLLLANDVSGVSVAGVLRPAAGEMGGSELVVQVNRKPFDAFATVNNRGSRFAGAWRATVQGAANSFTPLGERTSVVLFSVIDDSNVKEQRFGQLDVSGRLGSEGLSARSFVSFSPSQPGLTLRVLDVETRTVQAGASLTYPIIRSRHTNLQLGAGFDYTSSSVDSLGASLNDDRLSVVHLDASFNHLDSFRGATLLGIGIHKGLGLFGASDKGDINLSRAQGTGDFTKLTAEASRLQGLTSQVNLFLSLNGQFSNNKLLSIEEFRIGGEAFGRGYNPAELSGDSGLGAVAELRFADTTEWDFLTRYELYTFYDFGMVWNHDNGVDPNVSLASTGVGIRASLTDWLTAEVEVAKPLTRRLISTRSDGERPTRLFLSLSTQF